jgi:hypothetical protein
VPVRFQVDGDFYDHPKTDALSDAAVAMWTRAGSYSCNKLLDGFVPAGRLGSFTRARRPERVAAELVTARLWRVVDGGYQFHQWEERNLLKAEVEADRLGARTRKREQRRRTTVTGVVTVGQPRDVAGDRVEDADCDGGGTSPDPSRGSHRPSVSVSVSESVSGGGDIAVTNAATVPGRPPPTCPKHIDDPDPPPCHGCRDARQAAEVWDAADARSAALAAALDRQHQARERADVAQLAITRCSLCDDRGYRNSRPCNHDPTADTRRTNGANAARTALAAAKGPADAA